MLTYKNGVAQVVGIVTDMLGRASVSVLSNKLEYRIFKMYLIDKRIGFTVVSSDGKLQFLRLFNVHQDDKSQLHLSLKI